MPELASRQHVRDICGVVERALADGGATWDTTSMRWRSRKAPAWSVRCWSACRSRRRRRGRSTSRWSPSITLPGTSNRSGSSTAASRCRRSCSWSRADTPAFTWSSSEGDYELLGRTRDDAAGEAYDKVAKLLSLGYPGGPIIDRLAGEGNDTAIRWPGTRLTNPDRNAPERDGRFDFSFSGLKTAVLRHVRQRQAELGVEQLPHSRDRRPGRELPAPGRRDAVDRAFAAARWHGAKSIGIAGGVSANSRLRKDALAKAERSEIPVYIPRLSLSTDNAAMIAAAGLRKLAAGQFAPADLNAAASLPL